MGGAFAILWFGAVACQLFALIYFSNLYKLAFLLIVFGIYGNGEFAFYVYGMSDITAGVAPSNSWSFAEYHCVLFGGAAFGDCPPVSLR
jgi:hypothetical protein